MTPRTFDGPIRVLRRAVAPVLHDEGMHSYPADSEREHGKHDEKLVPWPNHAASIPT
jgi:hypothetical protein